MCLKPLPPSQIIQDHFGTPNFHAIVVVTHFNSVFKAHNVSVHLNLPTYLLLSLPFTPCISLHPAGIIFFLPEVFIEFPLKWGRCWGTS